MQNCVINMDRSQTNQKNFTPQGNQVQKKAPQDKRPPNQLQTTNMVKEVLPYCRPCDALHEESTCYMVRQILEHGLPKTSDSEEYSREPEYVNTIGQLHPVTTETWSQAREYSQQLDNLTKNFGAKPTNEQMKEMPKFKGITFQRRDSLRTSKSKQYLPKVIAPPDTDDVGLDLGTRWSKAKVSILANELVKIPEQREKLLKALNSPPPKKVKFKEHL